MTKICSNCGKVSDDTKKFCSNCGTKFDSFENEKNIPKVKIKIKSIFIVIVALLVIWFIVSALSGNKSSKNLFKPKSCKELLDDSMTLHDIAERHGGAVNGLTIINEFSEKKDNFVGTGKCAIPEYNAYGEDVLKQMLQQIGK